MFCYKCGATLESDDAFCSACGAPTKPGRGATSLESHLDPKAGLVAEAGLKTRPPQVLRAIRLLWLSWAIGIVVMLLNWQRTPAIALSYQAFVLGVDALFLAIVGWGILQGRNWARITCFVVVLGGIVPDLFVSAVQFLSSPLRAALQVSQCASKLYAVWLLFTAPGRSWFGRAQHSVR